MTCCRNCCRMIDFRCARAGRCQRRTRLGWPRWPCSADATKPGAAAGEPAPRVRAAAAPRRARRARREIVEELGLGSAAAEAAAGPARAAEHGQHGRRPRDARRALGADRRPCRPRAVPRAARGVDAVMVGAGTVRMERYGRLIRDADPPLRRQRGLSEEPLACIVSGRLALDGDMPLLADPEARVVIVTPRRPACRRRRAVEYVRARREGCSTCRRRCRAGARFGVRSLLCEGGPHLRPQLLAEACSTSCSCPSRRCSPAARPRAARRCGSSPAPSSSRRRARAARRARVRLASVPALRRRDGRSARGARRRLAESVRDCLRAARGLARDDRQQFARQLPPLAGDARRRGDPHDDLVSVELLERDPRRVAQRRLRATSRASPAGHPASCPARSRARRLTASGSRSGSTATLSTTLLGTMIESSPVANVV